MFLICAVVDLEFIGWKPVNDADGALLDVYSRRSPGVPADERFVFVSVDDASVNVKSLDIFGGNPDISAESREVLQQMMEGWPWDRRVFARAIERILLAGAALVALDIEFPDSGPGDDELASVIARYPGRILLASAMTLSKVGRSRQLFEFRAPSDSILPDRLENDPRVALANVWPDEDGVVRAIRYRVNVAQLNDYPASLWSDFPDGISLSARMAEALGAKVPFDYGMHRFRYSYRASESEFFPRPFYQLFVPRLWAKNFAGGADFKGKVVILGASADRLKDFHTTPIGRLAGPEVHLHQANSLLHKLFVTEPPRWGRIGLIVLAGILGWLPRLALRRPLFQMSIVILIGVGWYYAGQVLFDRAGFALPVVLPVSALFLVGLDGLTGTFAYELKLSRQVRGAFERYVGEGVVTELLNQPKDYLEALGGVTREVTILFSDLRDFTRATASLDAHALVTQLNEYFTAMVDCVFQHGGTLDKFMGDAVMAVWGNVRSTSARDDALKAARCAVAMREATARLNAKWREEGRVQFELGIGLNHGPVVVGNIGAPSRMDFTVIGDAVNSAWQLQERSKFHSGDILVSKSVAELIAPELPTQSLGEIELAGGVLDYYRIGIPVSAAADPSI